MAKKHRKKTKEYSPYIQYMEEVGRDSDYRSKLVQEINPPKPNSKVLKHKHLYKTIQDIENVIYMWEKKHIHVSVYMISKVISEISDKNIYDYFIKRIKELQKIYGIKKASITYTPNEQHSNAKSAKNHHFSTPSLYTIPEQIYINPSKKKPKYGYARDYFGRIQERDHYIENRPINPHQNYSNYDSEDDNDSIYDGFK